MKKPAPRPYFECKHEHVESLKAYETAAMMLHQAVRTAIQLGDTPERALSLLKALAEHDNAFAAAAYGERPAQVNAEREGKS